MLPNIPSNGTKRIASDADTLKMHNSLVFDFPAGPHAPRLLASPRQSEMPIEVRDKEDVEKSALALWGESKAGSESDEEPAERNRDWFCPGCTYQNEADIPFCAACET